MLNHCIVFFQSMCEKFSDEGPIDPGKSEILLFFCFASLSVHVMSPDTSHSPRADATRSLYFAGLMIYS